VLRAPTDTSNLTRLFVTLLAVASLAARPVRAQAEGSWIERLGIDKLRFTALGAQIGRVSPHGIEPTTSYSLQADYGELTPGWRIHFSATYWGSRFREESVEEYADSLLNAIDDPTGDAQVVLGDITVSDIVLSADARRTFMPSAWLRPYVGGGIATHIVNADGRLIDGTFVERATDVIAVGVAGLAGLNIRVVRHVALDAQARYDFLSLARFGSLRIGASYYFDPPRPRTR
jgi:opacity protein-like surface antigen